MRSSGFPRPTPPDVGHEASLFAGFLVGRADFSGPAGPFFELKVRCTEVLRLLKSESSAPPGNDPVDPLRALATAAAEGDREAERTLLVTLGPALLRTVRGVLGPSHPDVEDVLQEAMVALHGALAGFRGECRTSHFACSIALLTALNARRKARHRVRYTPAVPPEVLSDLAVDGRSPADARAQAERRALLRHLLDELPEPQAEAVALHVVLGMTVDETAEMVRVPRNTVRSRLRHALATLRERIRARPGAVEILEAER